MVAQGVDVAADEAEDEAEEAGKDEDGAAQAGEDFPGGFPGRRRWVWLDAFMRAESGEGFLGGMGTWFAGRLSGAVRLWIPGGWKLALECAAGVEGLRLGSGDFSKRADFLLAGWSRLGLWRWGRGGRRGDENRGPHHHGRRWSRSWRGLDFRPGLGGRRRRCGFRDFRFRRRAIAEIGARVAVGNGIGEIREVLLARALIGFGEDFRKARCGGRGLEWFRLGERRRGR